MKSVGSSCNLARKYALGITIPWQRTHDHGRYSFCATAIWHTTPIPTEHTFRTTIPWQRMGTRAPQQFPATRPSREHKSKPHTRSLPRELAGRNDNQDASGVGTTSVPVCTGNRPHAHTAHRQLNTHISRTPPRSNRRSPNRLSHSSKPYHRSNSRTFPSLTTTPCAQRECLEDCLFKCVGSSR